ncbi:MAG: hypothetical protein NVV68_03960 [Dokdonella sp.]|nr:hypothetical protein [Dokdonella sp.]
MKSMPRLYAGLVLVGLGFGFNAHADSPTCSGANETKLSWPATDPVWEMCWVPVNQSVGPQGSGLELRDVHYNGHLVMRRAHAPLLFAEYKGGAGGDCYRDWKDDPSPILANTSVQNQLGTPNFGALALNVCDVSQSPTASYNTCPYGQTAPAGSSCFNGVAIEDLGDEVRLTVQYRADWYMYSSRWAFFKDGRIQPYFGFGNRNGTFNSVTHWHHNYWRMEFDIDNAGNQVVSENGVDKPTEFSALRSPTGGANGGARTWEVRNPDSGRGYRLIPGAGDYAVPTNDSGARLPPGRLYGHDAEDQRVRRQPEQQSVRLPDAREQSRQQRVDRQYARRAVLPRGRARQYCQRLAAGLQRSELHSAGFDGLQEHRTDAGSVRRVGGLHPRQRQRRADQRHVALRKLLNRDH